MNLCIVQVRMGSKRFPGKSLKLLSGKPVIQHVLDRCRQVKGIDAVVCATSTRPENNPLREFCANNGYEEFSCPDENDVLRRYKLCSDHYKAQIIMRVTGDCPLIDPVLCQKVLKRQQEAQTPFASNDYPIQRFAKGLGCEVFTHAALDTADRQAVRPYDREHVSPWMHRNFRCAIVTQDIDESKIDLCIDYPEDIRRLERMMNAGTVAG